MRQAPIKTIQNQIPARNPIFLSQALKINEYLKSLDHEQLANCMHISEALAARTYALIHGWSSDPSRQSPAIDCFMGDVYSGLRSGSLSVEDRAYADKSLYIVSGLYGLLRPLDGIMAYRLEMAYHFPAMPFKSLYDYWGESLARQLPPSEPIINLTSAEYSRAIIPYISSTRLITPKFLTIDPKNGEEKFVAMHAKIARGAFARWLITQHTHAIPDLENFDELGYQYISDLSRAHQPVFVAKIFQGQGLSLRSQR